MPIDWEVAAGKVRLYCVPKDRLCTFQIVKVGQPLPTGMGVCSGVRAFKGAKVVLASTCVANA